MAVFDALISDIAGRFGLGASAVPLVREILNLVVGSPGGLSGFLDKLKSAGLGTEVASWLGHADAAAIPASQLDALGSTALKGIASKLGLGTSAVSTAAAYALPKLIGVLTPGGTVPASLSSEVLNFLNPSVQRVAAPATRVVEQVAPRRIEVIHDEPHITRWLWPLLAALGILGLGSYLLAERHPARVAPAVVQAPPVAPPIPQPTLPPRLALSNDNGVIHYSGSVHDEDSRTSIINALKAVFGADKI